jgi:hypothetical protein
MRFVVIIIRLISVDYEEMRLDVADIPKQVFCLIAYGCLAWNSAKIE